MPQRPTKGAVPVYLELPGALAAELKAFAAARRESVKDVVALAVRRHMDNPPAVPPLPPYPSPKPPPRRGRGAR